MKTIVSPSILSANFAHLSKDMEMINRSDADWVHIDIMDGVFVPNISFIEKSKFPMYSSIISLVFNVLFNYLFIFGKLGCPELGLNEIGRAHV